MASFLLEIVTPVRSVMAEDVDAVVVPTALGETGVLPRHEPLFSLLTEGEIKVHAGKHDYFLAIGGGFIEVRKGNVQILVTRASHADELNEAEIRKAQTAAREILTRKGDVVERQEAQALLRRSFVEMKVLSHRRRVRQGTLAEAPAQTPEN